MAGEWNVALNGFQVVGVRRHSQEPSTTRGNRRDWAKKPTDNSWGFSIGGGGTLRQTYVTSAPYDRCELLRKGAESSPTASIPPVQPDRGHGAKHIGHGASSIPICGN